MKKILLFAVLVFALSGFKPSFSGLSKDVPVCNDENFTIYATTSGGCTAFYIAGPDAANFDWVSWEIEFDDSTDDIFKEFDANTGFLTPYYGANCSTPNAFTVKCRGKYVCGGSIVLSHYEYYAD